MTRGPSRARTHWRAVVVAGVGLAIAAVILVEERAHSDEEASRDAARTAARVVLPVVRAIEDQLDPVALGADPATRDVDTDDPDGPSTEAAALARDTGTPVLDDGGGGLIVVARYDPAGLRPWSATR